MSLKLYYHPLSSFCHKALIALYEGQTPFEPVFVDLSDEKSSAARRSRNFRCYAMKHGTAPSPSRP
jgi:glutathione S-transferase